MITLVKSTWWIWSRRRTSKPIKLIKSILKMPITFQESIFLKWENLSARLSPKEPFDLSILTLILIYAFQLLFISKVYLVAGDWSFSKILNFYSQSKIIVKNSIRCAKIQWDVKSFNLIEIQRMSKYSIKCKKDWLLYVRKVNMF